MFTMDSRIPMPFCSFSSVISKNRISIFSTSTGMLFSIFSSRWRPSTCGS